MGNCLFLRKGETHTAPITGILASDLAVGSIVKLIEDNTPVEYMVVNQGIPANSNLYDSSCNGTWLLRKDLHSERQWHTSNVNDYANSSINAWLNNDFYNSLGDIEKTAIKQVKIPYRAGSGYGKTVTSGSNGLSAKIFLLSSTETGFNHRYMPSSEGATLFYFNGCAEDDADVKRVARLDGSVAHWWLRSPDCNSSDGAKYTLRVFYDGSWINSYCSKTYGIRPALVLPSNAIFDESTLILKGVR